MLQLIIVYIVLAITIGYSIYALVRYIRKKNSPCGDCSGCDLKNEITKNLKDKVTKDPNTCGCNTKKPQ